MLKATKRMGKKQPRHLVFFSSKPSEKKTGDRGSSDAFFSD